MLINDGWAFNPKWSNRANAIRWAWSVQGLSSSEKFILVAYADRANDSYEAFPSSERLAVDTGLNLKTVKAAIKNLVEQKLLIDTG